MRSATAVRAHALSVVRAPTTLALLVVLPPVVVVGYGEAMAAFPPLPLLSAPPATLGRINGAVFATAFLAGLLGLFGTVSATRADRRLVRCGFPRAELFATRLAVVLGVALVAAATSLAALWVQRVPDAPLLAYGVLAGTGVLYGALGVLVGSLLPHELEGSLALVLVADVDTFLSADLVAVETEAFGVALPELFPLYHPHALFEAAVLDGTLAEAHVLPAVGYAAVLLALAALAYARLTGGERA